MKKIMLIGDSIRIGYQAQVAALLGDEATLTWPDENCRFSTYTLFRLSAWVPDDDFDVIQWNNGQWDVCYMPDGKIHTPLAHYLEVQERIAALLLKKTKRLIFATTTPVWPQFANAPVNPRCNEDIMAYNSAATSRLNRLGIEINDLYSPIAEDITRYISKDMVHLTEAGYERCASCVAAVIRG